MSIILLANKKDLRDEAKLTSEDGKELAREISDEFEGKFKVTFFETSAKTGENVEQAFMKIAEETHKNYLANYQ